MYNDSIFHSDLTVQNIYAIGGAFLPSPEEKPGESSNPGKQEPVSAETALWAMLDLGNVRYFGIAYGTIDLRESAQAFMDQFGVTQFMVEIRLNELKIRF